MKSKCPKNVQKVREIPLLPPIIEKFPLEKCRKILNCEGATYTDDQLLKIRDFMYLLAEMAANTMAVQDNPKEVTLIIPLNEKQDNNEEDSNYLRTG